MIDLSKPVVWTSRGNVNEDAFEKLSEWEIRDENGNVVELPPGWTALHAIGLRDRDTGEIIKRGVWQLLPQLSADGQHGKFN